MRHPRDLLDKARQLPEVPLVVSSPTVVVRSKLLVLELWGIGDLTMATTLLRAALEAGWEVTLLAKSYARDLLAPTLPELRFIDLEAPWTAFRGKYRLWQWPWRALGRILRQLRGARFDAAVSVREDPRDHLLMWLAGARKRLGFPRRGSSIFLTGRLSHNTPGRHKVEDWRQLRDDLRIPPVGDDGPYLDFAQYPSPAVDRLLAGIERPILCLHAGARIAVRRWPAPYYAHVIRHLRKRFHFHLLHLPEADDYGAELRQLADSVAPPLSIGEMVNLFGRIDLLLGNDSGPGHVAAACGRPVISIFGPGSPGAFRPWGEKHHVVIRDICALRPCFDYCIYPEPYCLTQLAPEPAAREIALFLERSIERGVLPEAFRA